MPQNPHRTSTNPPRAFRLLHATADTLIADRTEALHRLTNLPGARLFIVQGEGPITNTYA